MKKNNNIETVELPSSRVKPDTNGGTKQVTVTITPPNIKTAKFTIVGTAPLVVHRFSAKCMGDMFGKVIKGDKDKNKRKVREAQDPEQIYNEARYVSPEGWDGFNVTAMKAAMVRACAMTNPPFKMTIAKSALYIKADGRDATEPQYGLIRIYGKPRRFEMVGRVETGQAYVIIRPMYDPWHANIQCEYDADQFTEEDITNLLMRAGAQVGLCEGRPFSKNSVGMGWGTFRPTGEKL